MNKTREADWIAVITEQPTQSAVKAKLSEAKAVCEVTHDAQAYARIHSAAVSYGLTLSA